MTENLVYILQDVPGTRDGRPKINIIGASEFGRLKVLLPETSQIILSPGPLVFKLRKLLKDYQPFCGIRYNKWKIQTFEVG